MPLGLGIGVKNDLFYGPIAAFKLTLGWLHYQAIINAKIADGYYLSAKVTDIMQEWHSNGKFYSNS